MSNCVSTLFSLNGDLSSLNHHHFHLLQSHEISTLQPHQKHQLSDLHKTEPKHQLQEKEEEIAFHPKIHLDEQEPNVEETSFADLTLKPFDSCVFKHTSNIPKKDTDLVLKSSISSLPPPTLIPPQPLMPLQSLPAKIVMLSLSPKEPDMQLPPPTTSSHQPLGPFPPPKPPDLPLKPPFKASLLQPSSRVSPKRVPSSSTLPPPPKTPESPSLKPTRIDSYFSLLPKTSSNLQRPPPEPPPYFISIIILIFYLVLKKKR
ncbi:proline-rich receptor-like protein kinase PERK2 [Vicia villosa]|uniref:proline-rich receptor-like protein kinase PERK2 n=1 Tax=Vicia villosa TaxID=3911 RepID=UPI00273C3E99|nr:proline-rich receptor-like protein kinase PERK2 [Vicia villosa]